MGKIRPEAIIARLNFCFGNLPLISSSPLIGSDKLVFIATSAYFCLSDWLMGLDVSPVQTCKWLIIVYVAFSLTFSHCLSRVLVVLLRGFCAALYLFLPFLAGFIPPSSG